MLVLVEPVCLSPIFFQKDHERIQIHSFRPRENIFEFQKWSYTIRKSGRYLMNN